jgi:hypothetical protein
LSSFELTARSPNSHFLGYLGCIIGEYLILYSRFHLLSPSKRLLRSVLVVIIVEPLLIEIPYTVFSIITTIYPQSPLVRILNVWVPLEALLWGVVDLFLSVVYILQVKKLWIDGTTHPKMRNILWRLVFMCAICFCANLVNITTSFAMTQRYLVSAISVSRPNFNPHLFLHTLLTILPISSQHLQSS